MNIGSILSQSFKYAFSNFSNRIREGFPPVLILTIAFNLLDYLISNEIATKFTIIIFAINNFRIGSSYALILEAFKLGS